MIATLALLMTASVSPTLGEVMRLAPRAAGERVLGGQEHQPIEQIAVPRTSGLDPPGVVELALVERAVPQAQGCLRKRWVARFRRGGAVVKEEATFAGARSTTEIALSLAGRCADGGYVLVNPGIELPIAFEGLSRLDRVRFGRRHVRFVCSDDTSSRLCASEATIRSGLARVAPWAISLRGHGTIIWLGIPGQVVTEVRFDPTRPDVVHVERRVPSPA